MEGLRVREVALLFALNLTAGGRGGRSPIVLSVCFSRPARAASFASYSPCSRSCLRLGLLLRFGICAIAPTAQAASCECTLYGMYAWFSQTDKR
jgi:hypothetical protein